MQNEIILEARESGRDFNGFTAVEGVSLTVRKADIHAIIGPNGAGKTTFCNLLTSIDIEVHRGERVSLRGRNGAGRTSTLRAIFGLTSRRAAIFDLASPPDVSWHPSIDGVIMMILGGVGSFIGPVLGATVMVLVRHWLAEELDALVPVIMGVIFVVCVLVFRGGIVMQLQAGVARQFQALAQRVARRSA
jgi:energy-coupling factor transporter ATP-binding protein EcfA2